MKQYLPYRIPPIRLFVLIALLGSLWLGISPAFAQDELTVDVVMEASADEAAIGETVDVVVKILNPAPDIAGAVPAVIDAFTITIDYDPAILRIDPDLIVNGDTTLGAPTNESYDEVNGSLLRTHLAFPPFTSPDNRPEIIAFTMTVEVLSEEPGLLNFITLDETTPELRIPTDVQGGRDLLRNAADFVINGNTAPVAVDDAVTENEDTFINIPVLANDTDPEGDTISVTGITQPSNGTAALQADGSVNYLPNANYFGPDSFTYEISDGEFTDEGLVEITVSPVNDAPVAVDDNPSIDEDQFLIFDPTANDTDVDNDTADLSVASVSRPATVNANGDIVYIPPFNFNGTVMLNYSVSDGLDTDDGVITVTVRPVNDPPVANDDQETTDEDTPLIFNPSDNDTDVDGDDPFVSAAGTASNGTTELNPDGTVTYTPDADFNGQDSFTYTTNDGNGGNDAGLVEITVNPINDDPVAVDDTEITDEDTPLTFNPSDNDTDVDGDTLSVESVGIPGNGTAVLNPDGTVTYTPDADFNGQDSFTYTVSDGNGGSDEGVVNITVNPINDDPVAVDDLLVTDEDTPASIDPSANDTDVDGDTLSVESVGTPNNGTAVLNPDGTVTYTPDADFNGPDSFTYTINDGNGGTAVGTVSVRVEERNDPPIANDDSANGDEDTVIVISVLTNDSDTDGPQPISITQIVNAPNDGQVVINADGTISYTPDANFFGDDSFVYEITDGDLFDSATVRVTVDPVNDPPQLLLVGSNPLTVGLNTLYTDPGAEASDLEDGTITDQVVIDDSDVDTSQIGTYTVFLSITDSGGLTDDAQRTVNVVDLNPNEDPVAVDDNYNVDEDNTLNVAAADGVLDNDTDADGDSLTAGLLTNVSNGTLTLNADGSFDYTPDANFNGQDSFTYEVSDGNGGSDEGLVEITVNPINDDPVAVDDTEITDEDTPLTFNPSDNDTDVDGDTLSVESVGTPNNGTAVLNPDGTVTYTPDADFNGQDSFTYAVSDGNGGSDEGVVNITVNPINDDPVAVDDTEITDEDTPLTFNPSDNDTDVDGDTLSVESVGTPSNGTAELNPDGTVTYTPDADFNGQDSFTYAVSDGNGGSDEGVVNITVNPINDDPVAIDDLLVTDENTPASIDPSANDTDVDGDTLSVESVGIPSNGTAELNPDGTVTYTPNTDYSGSDSFSYIVSDGNGGTDEGTVSVRVADTTPPPDAVDDEIVTDEDTSVTFDPLANDTDFDDVLSVSSVGTPSNGTAVINPDGTVTYTPNADFFGFDSFTYEASDNNGFTDQATVNVTVLPINDAPVAVDDVATTRQAQLVVIAVLDNDTDVDNVPADLSAVDLTQPANGSATINPDGTINYQPDVSFSGVDTLTYRTSDGNATSTNAATVTITVIDNEPPVGVPDNFNTPINTPVSGNVLTNDTDAEGDTISVSVWNVLTAQGGTVSNINATGDFTYTPPQDFVGEDSFSYQPGDGTEDGNLTTVTITVEPEPNRLPEANDDVASTNQDTPVVIDVLANDSDPDGDDLTVIEVSDPTGGTATINPDGTITHPPDPGFVGVSTFTYTISDGNDTATATVEVTIDGAPVLNLQDRTDTVGEAVNFDIDASDPEGQPLRFIGQGFPPEVDFLQEDEPTIGGTLTTVGDYTVLITVIDANGQMTSASFLWTVTEEQVTETPEPTEDPTEPTEDPTEPTEDPTEPTETPTEPTETPTEPTETPTEPTETPTEPTETPTEPTETPTEPTETPSRTPTEPTETPTEPTETATPDDGIEELSVCWSQDRNNAESVWYVTNPNPVPLYAGQPDKVVFSWEVTDAAGNVLQRAERWDQTGTVQINTRLATQMTVTWYIFDNNLSEPLGTTTAIASEDVCD